MAPLPESRIVLVRTEDDLCSRVEVAFSADHDLTFVLEQLEAFLKAVGFIFEGTLDIVPPESEVSDPPESGSIGSSATPVADWLSGQPLYGTATASPDPRVYPQTVCMFDPTTPPSPVTT